MSHLNTIYNQLLHPESSSGHRFENLVKKHNGDYYVKYFTCWTTPPPLTGHETEKC